MLVAPYLLAAVLPGTPRDQTDASVGVLVAMMIGLVPYGWFFLVQRAFYAYEDARAPFLMQIPIAAITLLVGASAAGLEVQSHDGEWVPFTSDADTIVVNIGDMLQRLTNHVYPPTTHRVVNPPAEQARKPRYSTPFFLHPNPDFLIDVLPQTVTAENPSRYPEPITAHDYLLERLREIKLA